MSMIAEFDAVLAEPAVVEVEVADPHAERRATEARLAEFALLAYSNCVVVEDNRDAEITDTLYARPAKVAEDLVLGLMLMCDRDGISFARLVAAAAKRHCLLAFPVPDAGEDEMEQARRFA